MSVLPESGTESALDAYSRIVTEVAATLTPHVAALRVTGGAGSAVVFTPDGLLLTNAHVVARARGGRAVFSDGTESDARPWLRKPVSTRVRSIALSWSIGLVSAPTTFSTPPPSGACGCAAVGA